MTNNNLIIPDHETAYKIQQFLLTINKSYSCYICDPIDRTEMEFIYEDRFSNIDGLNSEPIEIWARTDWAMYCPTIDYMFFYSNTFQTEDFTVRMYWPKYFTDEKVIAHIKMIYMK